MDYRGSTVRDVVVVPVDDHVVSVHIASRPHILPRIEGGGIAPPCVPGCQYQHIIRTPDSVVVVEVEARVVAYPRTLLFSQIEAAARDALLEILEKDNVVPTPVAYANGLKVLTQRIVRRMQQHGVEITRYDDCGHERRMA